MKNFIAVVCLIFICACVALSALPSGSGGSDGGSPRSSGGRAVTKSDMYTMCRASTRRLLSSPSTALYSKLSDVSHVKVAEPHENLGVTDLFLYNVEDNGILYLADCEFDRAKNRVDAYSLLSRIN